MKIFNLLLFIIILFATFVTVLYYWSIKESYTDKLFTEYSSPYKNKQPDSTIQVMSYNLGYLSGMTNNQPVKPPKELFSTNLQKLKQLLQKNTPDIICFQEIDYFSRRSYLMDQHDSIASAFYPWSVKAINWDKNYVPFPYWPPRVWFGKILSGQSIMSKWELSSSERLVLQQIESTPFYYNAFYLDRLLVTTIIRHPVHDFILMDLHAEAFDSITRNRQLEVVYQHFKQESKKFPVILAGDFNASPESGEPGILLFLNDSAIGCAVLPHSGKPATYPSESPVERIDYIFFSKEYFIEIAGKTGTEFDTISDHLPVLATLKFCTTNTK